MKRKICLILLFLSLVFFLFPAKILAAKKFVKKTSPGQKSSSSFPVLIRYRSDKRGLILSLTSSSQVKSLSYSFTYQTNGQPQGIVGNISSSSSPSSRELLFGTCSTTVCTYHTNLSQARLSLSLQYTNGKKVVKNYRIKTYY